MGVARETPTSKSATPMPVGATPALQVKINLKKITSYLNENHKHLILPKIKIGKLFEMHHFVLLVRFLPF